MATVRDPMMGMDFTKFMPKMPLVEFDVDAVIEGQRKNMEAVGAAQKCALEGAQKILKYQVDAFQKAAEDVNAAIKAMTDAKTPQERFAKQTEAVQKAFERAVGQTREVSEMVLRSNVEVAAPLNKRFAEGLDEVGQMFKKAGTEKEKA
ncbi:MAG: phasin family protein [Proteobacteria bacterium]|nr:phasin family protein [Pseudomonadota bacterium]